MSYYDPPADAAAICPLCHGDIERHAQPFATRDGSPAYLCPERRYNSRTGRYRTRNRLVLDRDVLVGFDAEQALRDDADDYRMSMAGL